MCFIERETRNFILKFREIFPWNSGHMGIVIKNYEFHGQRSPNLHNNGGHFGF